MENKSDWSWTQFLDSGSQPDERVVAWVANIFVQGQKVDEAQKWQPRWWDGRPRIFPSLYSLKQRFLVCRNWPFSQMIPNCWQVTVGPHFAQPVRQHGAMLVQQSGAKFLPMDFGVPLPFEESQRLQWSSQNNLESAQPDLARKLRGRNRGYNLHNCICRAYVLIPNPSLSTLERSLWWISWPCSTIKKQFLTLRWCWWEEVLLKSRFLDGHVEARGIEFVPWLFLPRLPCYLFIYLLCIICDLLNIFFLSLSLYNVNIVNISFIVWYCCCYLGFQAPATTCFLCDTFYLQLTIAGKGGKAKYHSHHFHYYEMPFISINSPCQNVVGNPRKGKEVLKTFVREVCGFQAPENGIIFILPPDLASMMPMIAHHFPTFWPLGYPNVTSCDCLDWRWEESLRNWQFDRDTGYLFQPDVVYQSSYGVFIAVGQFASWSWFPAEIVVKIKVRAWLNGTHHGTPPWSRSPTYDLSVRSYGYGSPQIHQASNERIVVRGGNRPAIVAQLQQWVHYRGSVLMHGSN